MVVAIATRTMTKAGIQTTSTITETAVVQIGINLGHKAATNVTTMGRELLTTQAAMAADTTVTTIPDPAGMSGTQATVPITDLTQAWAWVQAAATDRVALAIVMEPKVIIPEVNMVRDTVRATMVRKAVMVQDHGEAAIGICMTGTTRGWVAVDIQTAARA